MNANRKELTRTIERIAPAGWHEQSAEVMDIYDRYREAADMMKRINRALGRAVAPPVRAELVSTKDLKLTDEMIDNSSLKSAHSFGLNMLNGAATPAEPQRLHPFTR